MSEKPAALEVVKSRLDEIQLGHFVLDLHSKNTSAAEIRGQLLAAMDANPRIDTVGVDSATFDFEVATKALSKYPERLHRVHPVFGESVYSARSTLLAVPEGPTMTLAKASLAYFDSQKIMSFKSKLQNLQDLADQAGTSSTNAWSFSELPSESVDEPTRSLITETLRELIPTMQKIAADPRVLALLAALKSPDQIENLSQTPMDAPSVNDLKLLGGFEYNQKLLIHKDLVVQLDSTVKAGSQVSKNFGTIPLAQLEADLKQAVESKLFKTKKLRQLAEQVAPFFSEQVSETTVASFLNRARVLVDIAEKVASTSMGVPCVDPISIEPLFEPEILQNRIARVDMVKDMAFEISGQQDSPTPLFLSLSTESRIDAVKVLNQLSKLFAVTHSTGESFTRWLHGLDLESRLQEVLPKWQDELIDSNYLFLIRWANLIELLEDLKLSGQLVALEELLSGSISGEDGARAFERAYLTILMEKLIDDHELRNFESGGQNANINKLKRNTDSLRVFNRETIAGAVVKSRTFDPNAVAGKAGSLRSELNKQKGQLPIRQLMKKYWETITEITPCVAASPDSVARFLDVDLAHFDLVVFDEASQLRVPNSIGALGRGNSAIVVGDSKQMPPTMLFGPAEADEFDEEAVSSQPQVESILDMAVFSRLPSIMLNWHYRSQDEALIAYSNKEYYGNALASFPSPQSKSKLERAVQFIQVENAEYVRSTKVANKALTPVPQGEEFDSEEDEMEASLDLPVAVAALVNTNRVEADQVVQFVLDTHKDQGDALNLGIVTMNEQQAKLIRSLLEEKADENLAKLMDPRQTRDYVFVRALEKVQGDERDVIVMSIGFARIPDAKDPKGFRLPQNFGPLTLVGSERRLNVAITRARKRVFVFCSFDPSDLRISDSSSEGMKGLKAYLFMAQNGPESLGLGAVSSSEAPDRHRIDIAQAIEALGYKTKQNYGLSSFRVDIAVEHPDKPGEYPIAILLDGLNWKSRTTANDREVLPVSILKSNMGWGSVERVWLPVWLKDRAGELERLNTAIKEAIERSGNRVAPAFEIAEDLPDLPDLADLLGTSQHHEPELKIAPINPKAVGVNIHDIELFVEVSPRLITDDKSLIQMVKHPEISRAIEDSIEILTKIEGPVHPDRAVNYIAKSFGLTHVQTARAAEILAVIPRSKFQRDSEGFLFPAGLTTATYTSWKRKNIGELRDVAMISLTELGNAMRDLCDRTHGMEHEELMRQTMFAFGIKTLSAPVRKRMDAAISFAVQRRVIVLNRDHFEKPE
jgi:hypothetical protein